MSVQSRIRTASSEDIDACLHTLTRAFEADPVCRWAWPDRKTYQEAFPAFCRAFGGAAFHTGGAHIEANGGGTAFWLSPGTGPDEAGIVEIAERTARDPIKSALFELFEQMDSFHPREPHYHLPLIGVEPSLQGRGIGSALLRHGLSRCDEEQMLAYLEATSEANRRLYERHGFQAIGIIQAGDSPPIVPMARKPERT